MKIGVITFPGSNCDRDCVFAVRHVLHQDAVQLWHRERTLQGVDAVIVPGGFSYGDYLRCGAMAAHSPIMGAVKEFAANGGLVLGICNGFQILTEAGLLPGVLMRNQNLRFVCRPVRVSVETTETSFTSAYAQGQTLTFPVAHMEGNYFVDAATLAEMKQHKQIAFRYAEGDNPNGSLENIAGVCNRTRNVLGLMPHPERVCDVTVGGTDGIGMLRSLL
jgi:phosphoribosylformylglycinamidine synthase